MRRLTCTQTQSAAANDKVGIATDSGEMSLSALQIARAAIARWSGLPRPAPVARDLQHVSPQARWLSQAQGGLEQWIARGGFAQGDDTGSAPLTTPQMYHVSSINPGQHAPHLNACID